MLNYVVTHQETGEVLFETDEATKVLFFENAMRHGNLDRDDAEEATGIAWGMYLNDHVATPLGHMADFVSENFEELKEMDGPKDRLKVFYEIY